MLEEMQESIAFFSETGMFRKLLIVLPVIIVLAYLNWLGV